MKIYEKSSYKTYAKNNVKSIFSAVQWGKIRGLSVEILKVLLAEPKTLNMIYSAITTTTPVEYSTVYRQLYRLRKYGLVKYFNGLYYLNGEMIELH